MTTLDDLHKRWFHWSEAFGELDRLDTMRYNDRLFGSLADSSIDRKNLQENERESIVECMNWENFIKWRSKFRNEDLEDICNSFIKYGKWWRIVDNPDVFGVDLTEKYQKWQKPKDAILDQKWADILIREGKIFEHVIYKRSKFWKINLSRELLIYWIEHDANFTVMFVDWSLSAFVKAWVLFDKELAYKFIDNWYLNVVSNYMLDEFKKNWFSLDQEFANKLIKIGNENKENRYKLLDLEQHLDEFRKNWVYFNQKTADRLIKKWNGWIIIDCIEIFKWLNKETINKLQDKILKQIQEFMEQKEIGYFGSYYNREKMESLSEDLARINKEYPEEWVSFGQEKANKLLKEWKDRFIISCIEIFEWLDKETINILQNQISKRIKTNGKQDGLYFYKRDLKNLPKILEKINKKYPEYAN